MKGIFDILFPILFHGVALTSVILCDDVKTDWGIILMQFLFLGYQIHKEFSK
jgi:hypothetical protein